ncbi:NADPH:quinone reductase-like Zn-dependent oxidoreductase [Novosphingobium hassiacum]|uniref:NADPH:quinone reductase-like Zn-dependent oxidoreductase n=1 Tax=Novosphingobium hassiacum TaxID=173676 RepID=A0A7W5ZY58_9SPHN|nr:NAD(P)-dependent alcohol dehydrogenase [Novosphingobium hassiacum]MBB3862180.1 NADPH:quinone reductase-like Zn-dependent oxidoreductase [Novosphingobium hassiacum]
MRLLSYEIGAETSIAALTPKAMEARQPGAGEILVRVEASSLNFHDLLVVTGVIPTAPGRIPLSDGVGIVEATGPGADRFAVGDRVMGTFFPDWTRGAAYNEGVARMRGDHVDGFAASYVTMEESGFTRSPASLDPVSAATLPCAGLTAWRALFVEGAVRPGETVLVQGSGGVSIFALQFAKAAGARVIATSGSPDKVDRLLALGADAVVDRMDPEWSRAVRSHCDGGVDHLIEVAGGDLSQSLQSLRVGGRLCLVGVLSRKPIQIAPIHLIHANRRVGGITVGSRDHQEAMIAAVEQNGIAPVVDSVVPLVELAGAFERFAAQQHFGKIAITCT